MKSSLYRLMVVILLIPIALSCKEETTYLNGNKPEEETSGKSEIVADPDVTASFPGGTTELANYLQKNLQYPAPATRANVSGNVILSLVVTEKGKLEDITVSKGIGFGCDEEAVRIVKAMPDWEPATKSGKKVRTKVNLPVKFVLEPF